MKKGWIPIFVSIVLTFFGLLDIIRALNCYYFGNPQATSAWEGMFGIILIIGSVCLTIIGANLLTREKAKP